MGTCWWGGEGRGKYVCSDAGLPTYHHHRDKLQLLPVILQRRQGAQSCQGDGQGVCQVQHAADKPHLPPGGEDKLQQLHAPGRDLIHLHVDVCGCMCMCVWMYVYVCVDVCVCMDVCVWMCVWMCTCMCRCVWMCVWMCVYGCVRVDVDVFGCMRMCGCVCHGHMHAYV